MTLRIRPLLVLAALATVSLAQDLPNETRAGAVSVALGDVVEGRIEGRAERWFMLEVEGGTTLTSVTVDADAAVDLRYHDAAGNVVQRRRGLVAGVLAMHDLELLPGTHHVSLWGEDAAFRLRIDRVGPPPAPAGARLEREPNDDPSRADRLPIGVPFVGRLSEAGDTDVLRFSLAAEAYVRLHLHAPAGGAVDAVLADRFRLRAERDPLAFDVWLLAGDHHLRLTTTKPVEGPYQLSLELLDPLALPADLEPNDLVHEARLLPAAGVAEGTVATHYDADWYRLPDLAEGTPIVFTLEGDGATLRRSLHDVVGGRAVADVEFDAAAARYLATVPAGGPFAASVEGTGPYRLTLVVDGHAPPAGEASPVSIRILSEPRRVAAFHAHGQRLTLDVELENGATDRQEVQLAVHLGDARWRATWPAGPWVLAGGETRSVQVEVEVAADAPEAGPVRVTVGARRVESGAAHAVATGTIVTDATEVTAVCGAAPLGPFAWWPLPDRILGGLDVAWTGLGARPASDRSREIGLFDGRTPASGGFSAAIGSATTVLLAGDGPQELVGMLLHPRGDGPPGAKLAEFRVLASIDGERFEPVLEGRMSSLAAEQAFVFDSPVRARALRLEYLSRQDGSPHGLVALGAFKAVAVPGGAPPGGPFDLADRAVGGFVVRSEPHLGTYALTDATPPRPLSALLPRDGGGRVSFMIGFHHARAALLDALEWWPHEDGNPDHRLHEVEVWASIHDPVGPWRSLGRWRPHDAPVLRLDAPTWTRYLRFEATDLEPGTLVEYPARLRVLEHAPGDRYRSILGEWGHEGRAATYEWLHAAEGRPPANPGEAVSLAGPGTTAADALSLRAGEPAEGLVLVGEAERWFRIEVPEGHDHVRIEMRGDASIAFAYGLQGLDGTPVRPRATVSTEVVTLEAWVAPGTYLLRTWEPPRAVVFAWDDSGSMGPFIDTTYATIVGFAGDVVAGRERVQLLPFTHEPRFLLPSWSDDVATLVSTLVSYGRHQSSSDAEANLAFAVASLVDEQRESGGIGAVLFVTDAESGTPGQATIGLWRALDEGGVRIWTFETSSGGSDDAQDRMQAWAVGGAYETSSTLGELEVGFARAACALRRPKPVRVVYESAHVPPPPPGELAVRRSDPDPTGAIVVVLDASGSMGAPLSGATTTRLAAARAVLTDLIGALEPGMPFALRAYGHVAPASCDTRLELPLGPLEREQAASAVQRIEPKLLSGTPLAASIDAVLGDLAQAPGPAAVVLLTDGEESCGGDPEAAIRALRSARPDVRVSIVAFDLVSADPAGAHARFGGWAALGAGRAMEAGDEVELRRVLTEALLPPALTFEVVDASGTVVARGDVDGDAVTLAAGPYDVRIGSGRVVEGVWVESAGSTELEVSAE